MYQAPTDDEVLAWWELYSVTGLTIKAIAEIYGRQAPTVRKHLEELGVLEPKPDPPPPRYETLTPREKMIADALGKITGVSEHELGERGHTLYARSFAHVVRGGRFGRKKWFVKQSAHERAQDALCSPFRAIVRMDMKRSGIL